MNKRIFIILVIGTLFSQMLFAQNSLLQKKITITKTEGRAVDILNEISKVGNFYFSYSNAIPVNREIKLKTNNKTIKEFLDDIFEGLPIDYTERGNKIILTVKKGHKNKIKLTQTVRGTIIDLDSRLPIIGASVVIVGTNPLLGTATDVNGRFRFENIPVGRITLQLSYLGYEAKTIPNLVVNSGKEVVLDLSMRESIIKMEEVVIKPDKKKGEVTNDMSLLSGRSISLEETKRYTGGMGDPARVVSSFAGVASTPDGSSDIIVRGNSPKYMQWRLDGVEILSPYHLNDQNSTMGALTALNNNLLATSDFYTSAFSSEFGNVLSSVMDVKLRTGNNEKFEAALGVGLMGTDITLEGPLKKGYGGSYLINYRYSTVSLIHQLGLVEVPGALNYQDLTFKLVLPTQKAGTFSIFGLGGLSGFAMENMVEIPGSSIKDANITKDSDKDNYLSNLGMNHILSINKKSFIKTSLSYLSSGISDDIYDVNSIKLYDNEGVFIKDSVISKTQTFKSRIMNTTYSGAITYNNKINAKNKIIIGAKYTYAAVDYDQSIYNYETDELFNVTNFNKNASSVKSFINWKYSLNENITIVAGLNNMNVLLNNKSTLEPRLAVNWQINNSNSIHAGYGNHSTMESIHNYFAKVEQADGSITEPNKDLDLLKANHFVLGYEKRINANLMAKVEVYYQSLYNLPVENVDTSYYATINEGVDYRYVDLVNKGTGENYGLEITIERFFDNSYYFLINGSIFNSTYKSLEGVTRNTQYNGNYLVNILCGKEFKNLGKKQNKTLALNAKVFFGGGKKYIPLLRDEQGNVAADPANNNYWDYNKAYNNNIDNVFQLNLSVSYKINKPRATHEIFLDLMNLTNNLAKLSEYYDESKPDKVGYTTQFGFFPNIMYRVYF